MADFLVAIAVVIFFGCGYRLGWLARGKREERLMAEIRKGEGAVRNT